MPQEGFSVCYLRYPKGLGYNPAALGRIYYYNFIVSLKPTGVIRGVLGNVAYIYYHKLAELSFGVK